MKRYFDIAVGGALFALLLPVIIVFMILIPLESRGSPIFTQVRVGRGGRLFRIYKLRTMRAGTMPPDLGPLELARHDAERVTRIGKWLRRTALDESPQLLQVVLGQMSLVGPRPLPPSHVVSGDYSPERDDLRPGMTGLSVVMIHEVTANLRMRKARIDRLYAKKRSFCLDLWIIASTFDALKRRST